MAEQKESCVKPSRGPIGVPKGDPGEASPTAQKEGIAMIA